MDPSATSTKDPNPPARDIPLCVDLDGTLIIGDMLIDGIARLCRQSPLRALLLPVIALRGRTALKAWVARHAPATTESLTPRHALLEYLHEEKGNGRKVILVTASHRAAIGPAKDLFPFDEILASTDELNLKGKNKAATLVERFGEKGFDYCGDSHADLAVWEKAHKAIVVGAPNRRAQQAANLCPVAKTIDPITPPKARDWARGLRIHQWSKNSLIAVPAVVGHVILEPNQAVNVLIAILLASLCASATYLWNDLLDAEFDRHHPIKSRRLLASGKMAPATALALSMVFMTMAIGGALMLAPTFALTLGIYVVTTLAYSLVFKRIIIADILFLAGLYLLRVIMGITVSAAIPSAWLFAFTFLFFLSLAAVKRYAELNETAILSRGTVAGRGYRRGDRRTVAQLGFIAGAAAGLVLSLYAFSPQVDELYSRPHWFIAVGLLAFAWLGHIWRVTLRGGMHYDPVVFALRDPLTYATGMIGLACFLFAGPGG